MAPTTASGASAFKWPRRWSGPKGCGTGVGKPPAMEERRLNRKLWLVVWLAVILGLALIVPVFIASRSGLVK